ncbi:hypothetical protein LAWI1_G006912 [Lachnellula willkommii]|uniref:Uncharacterized protein n=1 Tax=Lachnellula willkommii TaxID=215461 RepID=A0A559M4I8_9HELO|nr:hypothetical protein LAWI1_G006912 [Lachnellula willkommii]
MPPLKTGTCDTCSTEKVTLRPNPFTQKEQCDDCRDASIIGVTELKTQFKLKDDDLKDLEMVTEPKPAFLGGPDRRWYLVEQVKKRAEEKVKEVEAVKKEKEAAKKEKEAAKKEKEEAKKESAGAAKDGKRKREKEPSQGENAEEVNPPVKRGRGRPRKVIQGTSSSASNSPLPKAAEDLSSPAAKTPGLPKVGILSLPPKAAKSPLPNIKATRSPVPKAAKAPVADEDPKPKRGRGRPRKTQSSSADQ